MKQGLLATILFSLSLFNASAQRPGGKGKGDSTPLPLQGKMLPDVEAYTADGERISLPQQLKGKHGVIVFGCLT